MVIFILIRGNTIKNMFLTILWQKYSYLSQIENIENEPQEINQEASVLSDDNLSGIDLARALIQSDEKDKAKEVLLDIIKNGSANDAHEARVLNLQIS